MEIIHVNHTCALVRLLELQKYGSRTLGGKNADFWSLQNPMALQATTVEAVISVVRFFSFNSILLCASILREVFTTVPWLRMPRSLIWGDPFAAVVRRVEIARRTAGQWAFLGAPLW
jgi:hypothetical protein